MKTKLIVLGFFTLTSLAVANAAQKNLCDELIDSGTSTAEQIQKCQEKLGVSDYYKEQEQKNALKSETDAKKAEDATKKSQNIETKTFSQADLDDAGFGKPFFAFTEDYRFHPMKKTRITEGDSLCSYLGYEKALKSIVSSNLLNRDDSDKKGLIIDTHWYSSTKTPTVYKEDDGHVGARKYVEITCVRRKDKEMESTADALKKVVEDTKFDDDVLNAPAQADTSKIFDKTGPKKVEHTPYGYKIPDFMNDSKAVEK